MMRYRTYYYYTFFKILSGRWRYHALKNILDHFWRVKYILVYVGLIKNDKRRTAVESKGRLFYMYVL